MLQYEQQRAVGYPTFPGNIEALSILSSSPERSNESTPRNTATPVSPPPTTTQSSETSSHSSRQKRRQTLAACRPCRKRKSRCDGARPRCNTCLDKATPCVYSVEEGKTQQQASREELKAYRAVVCMLRKASPADTDVILKHLKQHDDVNDAVKHIQSEMMLRGGVISNQA
ncbi:hypothetical protein AUEXF2481DRAFT_27251 [Aureobasidium subglaciale EXF-2481]|uniref:Zn(2)-C6 fungal-type domain-containing protein n=1 Tax=Aureobasidium subglaciale (strain EXF-2481) TaxID=1043005 RepID=A0A074YP37_AURSE|nr:uncharacterized protein AUEXF2481DRAFT_27251 [Aureobasidium subglaciale EXF-2481]KEQ97909.1 hypothetical protein AUEXF2481DRAFT_27251 [Aureobasidium subglaciale EXF-2481]